MHSHAAFARHTQKRAACLSHTCSNARRMAPWPGYEPPRNRLRTTSESGRARASCKMSARRRKERTRQVQAPLDRVTRGCAVASRSLPTQPTQVRRCRLRPARRLDPPLFGSCSRGRHLTAAPAAIQHSTARLDPRPVSARARLASPCACSSSMRTPQSRRAAAPCLPNSKPACATPCPAWWIRTCQSTCRAVRSAPRAHAHAAPGRCVHVRKVLCLPVNKAA